MKIAFLGAGSVGFGRRLVGDILSFPELRDCELALVDPNEERLRFIQGLCQGLVEGNGLPTRISGHTDRAAALDGADFVITSIRVGDLEVEDLDISIPSEAGGLRQTVADTIGVGGVMKGLRTVPPMLAIARDMERYCPRALLLNYTNPMSMIMWAIQEATSIQSVGLCHSVQGTSQQLARYMGIDYEGLTFRVGGINHMAWFLELRQGSEDLYPRLREALADPDIFAKDVVRFEIMRHFGYFVTESTRHMSEYVPYFLPHDEEIERLGLIWTNEEQLDKRREGRASRVDRLKEQAEAAGTTIPKRSNEYGARIIHAAVTGEPRVIHGNVRNEGLIPNLPHDCCVEVPCVINRVGIQPCHFGELPPQLAGLCQTNVTMQGLVVRSILEERREYAYHAAMLDPNTSAQMSLPEIRTAMDGLLDSQTDWMPPLG